MIRRILHFVLLLASLALEAADLPPPAVRAGDRSVTLNWDCGFGRAASFDIERRTDDGESAIVARGLPSPAWADTDVSNGRRYEYRFLSGNRVSGWTEATPAPFRDADEFLDLLSAAAFDYYRFETNPSNGLVRDRTQPGSKCSIAAVGFALSAYCSAVERGWWTREAALERSLVTLETLLKLPQGEAPSGTAGYRGWFYHFLEMDSGLRSWKCELSSIDSALLFAGALDAQMFFNRDSAGEVRLRAVVDRLLERVDWAWMANGEDTFSMGWHPERGFILSRWRGYNEAMILYLMALGSAENLPVTWEAWTRSYAWSEFQGVGFLPFPPLFGHQFSHCWIDFRGRPDAFMRSKSIDYFENSRRATLAQRAYAIRNPGRFAGYAGDMWGFTASDTPGGYAAYGAPPAENEHGSIAPTAPGGSIAFAPEVCIPTLRRMYEDHRARLWGPYGFRDAFHPGKNWYASDTLGIDQGPILLMIENMRGRGPWSRFTGNSRFKRGMEKAGFSAKP